MASEKNGIKQRIAHSHATEDGKAQNMIMSWLRRFLTHLLLTNATDFIAVSKEAGESLFKGHPFEIVHNGINLQSYQFTDEEKASKRKELGLSSEDFIIGNIGRLEKQKNQERLLEIIKELNDMNEHTKLLLIGEGSLRATLEEKISNLSIKDSVIMTGERNDIPELLSIMDVFVMTSLYEGLPMVGLEAQAAGKKLVLSKDISKDTKVTPNVHFVELSASNDKWIDVITQKPFDNQMTPELKTYDASYTVRQMEKIYSA